MYEGLLHAGSMAVLVGIVYLNLDKLGSDRHDNFVDEVDRVCNELLDEVVRRDAPSDSLPSFARKLISLEMRRVVDIRHQICIYPCEVWLRRPRFLERLSALTETLKELRRGHFLRHVVSCSTKGLEMGIEQPRYQAPVALWFWADSVFKAPALRTILRRRDQVVIALFTLASGALLFANIGSDVFGLEPLGMVTGTLFAEGQFLLYLATILACVFFAMFARIIGGGDSIDMFPRCDRYLANLKMYNAEKERIFSEQEEDLSKRTIS